jgi:TetR/AcrR family transcriptional regulator, transcriptional repressor for nem operon
MRNSVSTKELILEKSSTLFNTKGYKATSISDITNETGFTKGAIYRHFVNKDQLELEALSYLSTKVFVKLREDIKAEKTAGDKLRAVLRFFESYISDSTIDGGCPLLNAAIESDDTNSELKQRAVVFLNTTRESLLNILRNGIKYKQLKDTTDTSFYASIIIASLEGAIMMSRLSGNNSDIDNVILHLNKLIKEIEL